MGIQKDAKPNVDAYIADLEKKNISIMEEIRLLGAFAKANWDSISEAKRNTIRNELKRLHNLADKKETLTSKRPDIFK